MTDPMETLRTTPMGLDRFQARELARPERLEELTAMLSGSFGAGTAARVLAVLGSEEAVPALAAAARALPVAEFLEALADCGPAGRGELRRMAGARGELREQAVLALARRTDRPAARPVLLHALAELVDGDTGPGKFAGLMVLRAGWLSGARKFADDGAFEDILDEVLDLRPEPPTTPLDALPMPCVARLRASLFREMEAIAERRRECTELLREDLAELKPAASDLGSVGRNDPCPCGSGRKFKKCCLDRQGEARRTRDQVERLLEIDQLVGFAGPPTREPDAPRLLELLVRDGRGPWAGAQERPLVRWASALRRVQVDPSPGVLPALVEFLETLPAPGLVTEDILMLLAGLFARQAPARLRELIPATARLSAGPGLSLLAAYLGGEAEEALEALLEEVLAGGRGPVAMMVVLEAAMEKEVGPELAEIALPFLRHAAEEDPTWQESLEAVLDWTRTRLWRPTATHLELPPGIALPWWEELEEVPERTARLARRLRLLCTWPEGFEEVAEDAREPLEEERRLRTELALRTAAELAQAMAEELAATERLLAERRDVLVLLPGEELLDWVLPDREGLVVAAAAGKVAAELGMDLPTAVEVGGRPALRQGGLRGRAAELGVAARVAVEEVCAAHGCEPPEMQVRVLDDPLEAGPAQPFEGEGAELVEKARRAELHPLELAAELGATSRSVTSLTRRRPAASEAAPEEPERAIGALEKEAMAALTALAADSLPDLLPVPLADDPVPARKMLRRVLRRLFRMGKIGESHTSVDLVSRGVPGHLRGAVKDSVDLLLAQGILRDKPTLVGQHTSIEPRHVAAVERFIEEGWLPHPGLVETLGLLLPP